ncbi:chlororespiratory reduction protein 7 [Spirulina sp. 06S082]|uniref:chlororespiratory reduction protein 7 n=1 Tax=Spirulina sp. 06S082 TaxID=3110248 RepID=UPI002B20B9C5|nr:chlororespiratory reduction protein 7 [Spirulina sp. 06S082]MEA5469311.1 chlororespiratory reduction protein 7 [Spirulina sp. 06S082]
MADSIMYQEDCYVILEPDRPEQFLSEAELLEKLKGILQQQEELPRDLQKFNSLEEQAQHLLETSCEFNVSPSQYLQWYVTRLEKR